MDRSPDPSLVRKAGRPLSFDREAALEQAMRLFWRHGYEGTSLSALTAAMRVTPPSIYTAFGDKKRLFLEAVRRYLQAPVTSDQPGVMTARDTARHLLHEAAIRFTGADTPPGCLVASAAISCSAAAADIRAELTAVRLGAEAQLRQRIERAIEEDELDAATDADALAAHLMAVVQGMSTLARDGATREKLMRVAESAMKAWPGRADPPD